MTEPSVCLCVCVCAFVDGLSRVGICIKVKAMETGESLNEQDRVRKLERWKTKEKRRRETQFFAVLLSSFQARESVLQTPKPSHRSCLTSATVAGTFQRIYTTHVCLSIDICLNTPLFNSSLL